MQVPLYDERGLNTARLANIYAAACGTIPLKNIEPLDEEERGIYDWAISELEKAEKTGRKIIFDIPFDPDDRYDGIYSKDANQLAEEIDRKLNQ